MAKVRLGTDKETGQRVFRDPVTRKWKPLEDKLSTYVGEDGIQRVYDASQNKFLKVASLTDNLMQGVMQAETARKALSNQLGIADDASLAEQLLAQQELGASRAITPEDYLLNQKAENQDFLGRAKDLITNPGYAGRAFVKSLPQSLTAMAPVIGAIPLGPVGIGAAGAIGSMQMNQPSEYINQLQQMAQNSGVDLTQPNALAQFKNKINPATGQTYGSTAQQSATKYAVGNAPFDAAAAVLGGSTAQNALKASILSRAGAGELGKGLVQQAALGAGAEVGGQMMQQGRVTNPAAVADETILELFGAPGEFLSHAIANNKRPVIEPEKHDDIETKVQEFKKNPSTISDLLTPDDFQRVVKVATDNGIPMETVNKWTEEDYVRYALRLKVIEARKMGVSKKTKELQDFRGISNTLPVSPENMEPEELRAALKQVRRVPEVPVTVTPVQPGQAPLKTNLLESPEVLAKREQENIRSFESRLKLQATLKAQLEADRLDSISTDAYFMAKAKASEAWESMKSVPAFRRTNPNKNKYVEGYARELQPQFEQELQKNPDFRVAAAYQARENGKFAKGKVVPPVEPGSLFTTEKNEAQRKLAKDIETSPEANRILSQVDALTKQSEQVVNATRAMQAQAEAQRVEQELAAFEQEQQAKRLERQKGNQQTVEAAKDTILPSAKTFQTYINNRKNSFFTVPSYNGIPNVVDINEQLNAKKKQAENFRANVRRAVDVDTQVRQVLKKYGLEGKVKPVVALRELANGAGGYVEGTTITLAALQKDPLSVLNHEVVHALKNLGLFTPQEWAALEKAAIEGNWVGKYGLWGNPQYSDLTDNELLEEAIAEHFSKTQEAKADAASTRTGLVDTLGKRIVDFFKQLRLFIEDALGISTPEEVLKIFDDIENGTIGSRTNDLARPDLNPIKYSNNIRQKIKEASKFDPSIDAALMKNAPKIWPIIGEFFTDITTAAGRIPALRPYRNALQDMRRLDHTLREMVNNSVAFLHNTYKPEARKKFTLAALILDNNNEKPAWPEKGKGMIVTLNEAHPDYGPAGTKVVLTAKEVEDMQSIESMYKSIGRQWINAVTGSALRNIDVGNGKSFTDLISFTDATPDQVLQFAKFVHEQGKITTQNLDDIRAIYDTVKDQTDLVENRFYIPHIRTSPFFGQIVNSAGERIATVALPTNIMGNQASDGATRKFLQDILNHYKKFDSTAQVGSISRYDLADNFALTEKEMSTFERLALMSMFPDNKELATKVINGIRKEFGARGFKKNWVHRSNVPGFATPMNMTNYLTGSAVIYGDRAARGISRALLAPKVNEAIATLRELAKTGKVHSSALKLVEEHYEYLTNPRKQEGFLSNKIRTFTFHMFLGFNPASAALNLFQTLHTSLPVVTAMFGNSGEAAKLLTKNMVVARKFLNLDITNPNVFAENIMDIKGIDAGKKKMVETLIERGSIKQIITEELQTKSEIRGIVGGETESRAWWQEKLNKLSNASSSLFSRSEAINRIAVALTAYELAEKAQKNDAAKKKLEAYLNTTSYSDVSITDPTAVAEAAVELSQFDTSQFNRAKAFRGALAVPTQFLAFPTRMVQLYVDLLRNAVGTQDNEGNYRFSFKDASTQQAFLMMLMGLWATSGVFGAIPLGGAATDAYDKIYNLITGVDPDIERKLREAVVDLGGSPALGEIISKGFMSKMLNADISDRVGASMFSGVSTDFTWLDLLGPTGGLVDQFSQFGTRMNQGHELLAIAQLMPPIARNMVKAMYEGEYGIVTQQGNVVPSDYSFFDKLVQGIGFTPVKLSETREALYSQKRIGMVSSVAKERFTDQMTTARVKAILSNQRGDKLTAQESLKRFKELRDEVFEFNKKASPEEKINVSNLMANVQRRVKEQVMAARGRVSDRKIPQDKRGIIKELVNKNYTQGYIKNEQ